jgi:hypothetical protein
MPGGASFVRAWFGDKRVGAHARSSVAGALAAGPYLSRACGATGAAAASPISSIVKVAAP